MFSRIRKRFTYANVAVTLALVFAMSGGAYAASRYVITSTKQISPKVLKALTGKPGRNGANGAPGTQGAQGPQGPAGPAGAKGETGAAGTNGTNGTNGVNGATGATGSPWTAGGTLPKGATEKGTWASIHTATAADEASGSPISFTIPLLGALDEAHVHYLRVGEKGNGKGCPVTGEAANPEAEAGYLCIYAKSEENAKPFEFLGTLLAVINPETEEFDQAGKTGTIVEIQSKAAGEVKAIGTWAVTSDE